MEHKNVSTCQCMSGINISINHCISKLNNQNIEITGLSKLNPVRIKKLPVRSRYALFYNVCTQEHVTDVTTTGCHLRHRDREPSRIQVKWLTRKFGKSRLLRRKRLRHKFKRSVPRSSHLHYIVENIMHCQDIRMKCIPNLVPRLFHCAPRWRKDPGPGWSRVSQILGDNNWELWGVGKANVAFEFKTIQGV
jgi:hypothetical protein